MAAAAERSAISTADRQRPGPGRARRSVRGALRRYGLCVVGTAALLAACAGGQAAVPRQPGGHRVTAGPPWTFDAVASAGLPAGAVPLGGAWGVRAEGDAPSPPNALCETATAPLAALSLGDASYTDVALSASLKLVSGHAARAAGLAFRIRDRDNYYVLEADAAAGRVRLVRYVGGDLGGIAESPAAVAAGAWHRLRAEAAGDRLRGFLDDRPVIDVADGTHAAGAVGLWTRADSSACFDDVDAKGR